MADVLADAVAAGGLSAEADDGDALAFEHVEAFNMLCVGESGLGKSTFLRDIFAHLDPTKFHEARRRVAEQRDEVTALEDAISRNEQESRQCDDTRSLQLREEKVVLKAKRDAAREALEVLRNRKREQERAVAVLRGDIQELEGRLEELRRRRDAEEDDEAATRLGKEVIELQDALNGKQRMLSAELRRSNLDKEEEGEGGAQQTTEVVARLIREMPLYEGARQGLDVTLIDTPGYGDLLVDTLSHSSAAKVCTEVERRISLHLGKERATRPNMPLDDEKKYWNELVHLCLFFISPHRMKRADVELMKRLHALVPLVVVIAKSDTMTTAETRAFKHEVRQLLRAEQVSIFTFDQRKIKEVEALHTAHASPDFKPLYGGSDGTLPWAVMGADESRREYIWGTAITNEPCHSELPALRDLLLRAGGWQQLKREASLKAAAAVCQVADRAAGAARPAALLSRVGGALPRRRRLAGARRPPAHARPRRRGLGRHARAARAPHRRPRGAPRPVRQGARPAQARSRKVHVVESPLSCEQAACARLESRDCGAAA